jgi:hypothetical protein
MTHAPEVAAMSNDEALEVLRAVWRGQGQYDLDEGKSCKRMADVGFEADGFEADAADLAAAWKARLAREGKLRPGSLRELVLGSDGPQ